MIQFLFTQTPFKYLVASLWRDEAFSYLLAKKNVLEIILLTIKDFTPPLYYLILHFWMKIFGHTEIALRILSLCFFWATLYVMFLFMTKIFKIKPLLACIFLFLFAANPFLHYYAFEARAYTMLAFFGTLAFYLLRIKKYNWYTLVVILGLYTHYCMVLVMVSQVLYVFLKDKKHLLRFVKQNGIAILAYIPWILFFIMQKTFVNTSFWIVAPPFKTFFNIPGIIYTGYEVDFGLFDKQIFLVSLFIMAIIIPGVVLNNKSTKNNENIFLGIWAFAAPVLAFFLSYIKPFFLPRYLIFANPGMLLLIIYGMRRIPKKLAVVVFLMLFLITSVYGILQIRYREKENIRQVIKEIKYLAKPNDLIYVTNELHYHVVQYYFDENRVFIYQKSYEEIPQYVGKILILKSSIVKSLPTYPTKAFVLHDNLTYSIEAMY